jgi:hypothetical protein
MAGPFVVRYPRGISAQRLITKRQRGEAPTFFTFD